MRVLAGRDPVRYTFALLPMPSHDALSPERVQPLEHDGNSVAMMNPRSMAEDIRYGGSCRVPIECMRVYAQAQVCDLLPKHTRCPAPNFWGGARVCCVGMIIWIGEGCRAMRLPHIGKIK